MQKYNPGYVLMLLLFLISGGHVASVSPVEHFLPNGSHSSSQIERGLAVQYREGDILLGSLMPQHDRHMSHGVCGNITSYGVQAIEVINMLLDKVNANQTILPNVTLGMISLDTCGVDTHAVRKIVKETFHFFWHSTRACTRHRAPAEPFEEGEIPFAGFIGAVNSDVTILVSKVLQVFEIPQISFWSTNSDISDKQKYPTVFRTVPSDAHQVQAMLDFVKMNGWNYISVVYTNSYYGDRAFAQILRRGKAMGICVVHELSVDADIPAPDAEYQRWIKDLVATNARAVIIFTGSPPIDKHPALRAAWNIPEARGNFTWIGSDAVSGNLPPNWDEFEHADEFKGFVGFLPKAKTSTEFDEYFTKIALKDRLGKRRALNPWFAKYFEKSLKCDIDGTNGSLPKCNESEQLMSTDYTQSAATQYISDALMAYVHALDQLHKDVCNGTPGLCYALKCLAGTKGLATKLFPHLRNVSFRNIHGDPFQFDRNQDGPIVYDLLTLGGSSDSKWVTMGSYVDGVLRINDTDKLEEIQRRSHSVCSEVCKKNEKTKFTYDVCCWLCVPCDQNEIVSRNECVPCGEKHKPNGDWTACVPRDVLDVEPSDVRAVIPMVVSTLGIFTTTAVVAVYVKHRNTPIVKACSKELSIFVLVGVLLCFVSGYVMALGVTARTCAAVRTLLALGPTFMYSGLLTKTVRIVIIFQSKTILKSYMKAYIKPLPQVVSTAVLVTVQVFVLTVWFLVSPSVRRSALTNAGYLHYHCGGIAGPAILIALVYPAILIVSCTVMATINRNVPTGFRETRYIGFTMYTTCVIWLAFAAIELTNTTQIRLQMMTQSLCLSLSALTVVAWMFLPRCYDILLRPDRNTPDAIMDTSVGRSRSKSEGLVVIENRDALRSRAAQTVTHISVSFDKES